MTAIVAELELTRNGSLTRVRPFFEQLLHKDPTAGQWLFAVLGSGSPSDRAPLATDLGMLDPALLTGKHHKDNRLRVKVWMPRCFEHPLYPSSELLEFCLLHPDRLQWPLKHGSRDENMGPDTLKMRKALIFDEPPGRAVAQQQGLRLLHDLGPEKPERQWWAFEGPTEVDCFLRTDTYTLLVEGKRTEDLSDKTRWLPGRNQLARNLEAAANTDRAGVLLAVEQVIPNLDVEKLVGRGCPHLDEAERKALIDRFLGQATWRELCRTTGVEWASLPSAIAVTPKDE
ncbi:MAG: hypothetical protein ACLP50_33310 [Solirubrobacteraceae bacterium]